MDSTNPQLMLRQMLTGYWISQAVYVAAKLDLAEFVAVGPRSADELANVARVDARSLYRLLRTLASVGVFREDAEGRFEQTELSECLRSSSPHSQRAVAIMMGEEHYQAWGELLAGVRTGKCPFEIVYNQNIFDYLAERPEQAKIFDAAMTGIHGRESQAMLDVYDFSDVGLLADIGGGNGSLLAAMLQRHPGMRGLLFDLGHVAERSRRAFEAAGVAQRVRVESGSFFDSVPPDADVYLLRHIIHDWDDERARKILVNCRAAMPATGRLLLVESVLPPGNDPSFGKLLDLTMLVVPGGIERTEKEYRELLRTARFELTRVVPTPAEVAIVEARPL